MFVRSGHLPCRYLAVRPAVWQARRAPPACRKEQIDDDIENGIERLIGAAWTLTK